MRKNTSKRAITIGLPGEVIDELPERADRVGNLIQKELSAYKVGVTREKYLRVIKDLLEAVKEEVYYDKSSKECRRDVADLDRRAKGAEMAGKYFSDFKEREAAGNVTHNKIIVQWLSVSPKKINAEASNE